MADGARRRPIETSISAITYGFMASKVRRARVRSLPPYCAGAASTHSALITVTGIAENRLVTLLAAPNQLGLISEAGERLINAPATARYLVTGAPGDFRDVRLVNGEFGYESFRHLGAALRGERVFPDKGFYEGMIYDAGIGGERFSSAQHTGSLPARPSYWPSGSISGIVTSRWTWAVAAEPTAAAEGPIRIFRRRLKIFPRLWIPAKRHAGEAVAVGKNCACRGQRDQESSGPKSDVVLMSYIWSAVREADLAILAKRAAGSRGRASDRADPGGMVGTQTRWSPPNPPGISLISG